MEITKEQLATLVAKAKETGQLQEQVRVLEFLTNELERIRQRPEPVARELKPLLWSRSKALSDVAEFINKGDNE
jgi:seryl-tRNA(Sec) selenium transferase